MFDKKMINLSLYFNGFVFCQKINRHKKEPYHTCMVGLRKILMA